MKRRARAASAWTIAGAARAAAVPSKARRVMVMGAVPSPERTHPPMFWIFGAVAPRYHVDGALQHISWGYVDRDRWSAAIPSGHRDQIHFRARALILSS